MKKILAFDFGASSGRAILAEYDSDSLTYKEVHRFENNPVTKDGLLCWDFNNLMKNVHIGIEKAGQFDSIAFDTWGVDFGLLDKDGSLLALPVHYRDTRTESMPQKVFEKISPEKLYAYTGNQIMAINTLFQLTAVKEQNPDLYQKADKLLFMPDLFSYYLCKNKVCETTIASTSQMFNQENRTFSSEVLSALDIDKNLFAPTVKSGTVIGEYKGAKVIAAAGHDTQCAVAAMPCEDESSAFLSCGTWSLLGCELEKPILTKDSMDLDLSNEQGANGKINYLKNIIGLWLIQESRRQWKREGFDYSYAQLEKLALESKPLQCFIDPDSAEFAVPGDIPQRVKQYCEKTNQYIPQTVGEIMRCIYESLALKYRYALGQIEHITNKKFEKLHILGGGTKDGLLCQMTADCLRIPVIAGPIEATALGNIIIQLTALGEIKDINQGRILIKNTETVKEYTPSGVLWDEAYEKYKQIITK